jgi:hypothetical protein
MEKMRRLTNFDNEYNKSKYSYKLNASIITILITCPLYGLIYEKVIRKIPFFYQGVLIYSLYRSILYLNIEGAIQHHNQAIEPTKLT